MARGLASASEFFSRSFTIFWWWRWWWSLTCRQTTVYERPCADPLAVTSMTFPATDTWTPISVNCPPTRPTQSRGGPLVRFVCRLEGNWQPASTEVVTSSRDETRWNHITSNSAMDITQSPSAGTVVRLQLVSTDADARPRAILRRLNKQHAVVQQKTNRQTHSHNTRNIHKTGKFVTDVL